MPTDHALPKLPEQLPSAVRGTLDRVVGLAISGLGRLKGAEEVAEEHLATARDAEHAVERLVRSHVRLAGVTGFVTALGGAATLPISLSAGVGGLYLVSARMTAGIAHLRGHDLDDDEVRQAVAACLLGSVGSDAWRRRGGDVARRVLTTAIRRVPGRAGGIVGRLASARLRRVVPLVGAPVASRLDRDACRDIAADAKEAFVPVGRARTR